MRKTLKSLWRRTEWHITCGFLSCLPHATSAYSHRYVGTIVHPSAHLFGYPRLASSLFTTTTIIVVIGLCVRTKRKPNEKNGKRREVRRANTGRSNCIPSRTISPAIMCALNAASSLARSRNCQTCPTKRSWAIAPTASSSRPSLAEPFSRGLIIGFKRWP
jgi:hypothetical protein